jgi:hypothetical protein
VKRQRKRSVRVRRRVEVVEETGARNHAVHSREARAKDFSCRQMGWK